MASLLVTLTWLVLTVADPATQAVAAPAVEIGDRRAVRLFPAAALYPYYKADLHRPRFGLAIHSVADVGVADSGEARFDLRLGGRFGLLRVSPRDRPERAWQLSIIAGFDGQFDIDNSDDNIGWDGNYGLAWTASRSRGLAFKVALLHTSSHVGDEYAERTGRQRIRYTREEINAAVSWQINEHWHTYAEAGWGYILRNKELMEPGRAQLGLEYESGARVWKKRLSWYAALDLSTTEERDWSVDTSIDLGLLARSGARTWRVGVGFYDGRVPLGEFFQDDERYLTLGLWLDV